VLEDSFISRCGDERQRFGKMEKAGELSIENTSAKLGKIFAG
jgi:hypothetical protein